MFGHNRDMITIEPPNERPKTSSTPNPTARRGSISERAQALAENLLTSALAQQSRAERAEGEKLGRLMSDPAGKSFTLTTVDRVFRSSNPVNSARRWRESIRTFGVPSYPPLFDRFLIGVSAFGSRVLPGLVMRSIAARMRADSARVILAGEKEPLHRYLETRAAEGFRINLNHLGEAVLGEQEAAHRLSAVLGHLDDPAVNYISVKISAIYSQINLLAWDETLKEIQSRLRTLYRSAAKGGKFVNLDMEEYRDLALTVAAFRTVLDEAEFRQLSAGIVLQAYLPDSFAAQRELTEWAKQRVAGGGSPIKIRLVKGANLAMEAVEAELHGWHAAPYATKAETDANFRRMLEYGCEPDHAASVRIGVASHNLFDVALALILRADNGVEDRVEIEMLEGMANHQARAVRTAADGLLLYAPAVQQNDFLGAMAYLVRRLDENTSPENFLRDMFAMRPGSPEWERQRQRFVQGWNDRKTVSAESRRRVPAVNPSQSGSFENEPDTDWTQPAHRDALASAIRTWQPETLPVLPNLDSMLCTAGAAQPGWEATGETHRASILNRVAEIMSMQRPTTLACMRIDANKAVAEGDGEVSEAIDFARYYARTGVLPDGVTAKALGVVAVVAPWNFPYAIPAGGVLAALMAGNSVILKPAPATVQTAWLLAKQLWEAGVPRDVLHFFPCDNTVGHSLITDERIACVVLTGSYETARKFQDWRPSQHLLAETSGKNALVITAQADRELAVKDLVRSAFGHAGQKCSAASLAIVEAEVYDSPDFRRQLRDAATSLHAGPSTDARSVVTPVVLEPAEKLLRALTKLDEGEEWLLEPRRHGEDLHAWTPGIKIGVRPGSWFHKTECFGPLLGIMRAESLAQATEWQNATDYGLTAGLHSLDPAEIAWWRDRVQAGNLYVNRPITGAIVQRQPFGGWKRSCIGPGAKAGGPNYLFNLRRECDHGMKTNDYGLAWSNYFAIEHDPSALRAESNIFRYRPCRGVILRLERRDPLAIERAQLASQLTGSPLTISIGEEESDELFIARLPELAKTAEFLRTVATPGDDVLRAAYAANLNWINAPIIRCGRIELSRWLREQSISETLHRYGQLSEDHRRTGSKPNGLQRGSETGHPR